MAETPLPGTERSLLPCPNSTQANNSIMNLENDNIIGIVGGMGPQSGVAVLDSIHRHTDAVTDQQHLSAILLSLPKHIADRTAFLDGEPVPNPAYAVGEILKKLEDAGARIAGIACNTCHAGRIYDVILDQLSKRSSRIRMVHMPAETCRYLASELPFARRIGVMSTNGAYKAGIYRHLLHSLGYEVVLPEPSFQNEVIHKMVYDRYIGIKAHSHFVHSEVGELMDKAMDFFAGKKTDAIILGCTELSLAHPAERARGMHLVDSIDCLARALIREAKRAGVPEGVMTNQSKILM